MKTKGRQFICRWLFGYRPDCRASSHLNGWAFGIDTRRGRFLSRVYTWLALDLPDQPRRWRLRLADHFARLSLRLRGDARWTIGYFEDADGNRAAYLRDRIDHDLYLATDFQDPEQRERFTEQRERVRELAALALAVEHRRAQP